jgi:alpha-beta hydrolase superfamily lysophospholipase
MKPSESVFADVRGLRYHLRCWGDAQSPKLFLLHGWMDVSASFQFLVDALRGPWRVIAPDWRGYGRSQERADSAFRLPGDLDELRQLAGRAGDTGPQHERQCRVSLTGVRADQVKLVNLEEFGRER